MITDVFGVFLSPIKRLF